MAFLINPYIYAAGCPSNLISTTSLGAYYNFNGDSTDSSGNGLNGTDFGVTYTSGKIGDALTLSGAVGSYVTVANSSFLEGSGGNISVAAWINITDFSSGVPQHIVAKLQTLNIGWRFIVTSVGELQLGLGNSGLITVAGSGSITAGQWYHVAFTYNNNTYYAYINGSEVDTASIGSKTITGTGTMDIGRRSTTNSQFFKGQIDELSVWQRVLSLEEIQELAAGTCPLKS